MSKKSIFAENFDHNLRHFVGKWITLSKILLPPPPRAIIQTAKIEFRLKLLAFFRFGCIFIRLTMYFLTSFQGRNFEGSKGGQLDLGFLKVGKFVRIFKKFFSFFDMNDSFCWDVGWIWHICSWVHPWLGRSLYKLINAKTSSFVHSIFHTKRVMIDLHQRFPTFLACGPNNIFKTILRPTPILYIYIYIYIYLFQ